MLTKEEYMNAEIKNTVPNEMLYGFAGATLVLAAILVLSLKLMEQTIRTGTAVILGIGVAVCGYLTYWAYRKRKGEQKRNNSKGKRGICFGTN